MSRIKPMLFNTDMVRAILDGRKTVTRRLVKPKHGGRIDVGVNPLVILNLCEICETSDNGLVHAEKHCSLEPPYQPGDILYVRETWQECCRNTVCSPIVHSKYCFKASVDDSPLYGCIDNDCGQICKWRPSIHMPKEAARIWLKVTDVRVERLQDMETADDANYIKEGAKDKHDFIRIWNSTVSENMIDTLGWYGNPYVLVIEFERCETPEGVCK